MNISVCITVLNEEKNISSLLNSLLEQSLKPKEIIVVDGGSTDKTREIIGHYQKRFREISLLKEKCSRSVGRNLSIEIAKSEIIALTDAGCIPEKNWLEKITFPLKNEKVGVVAGFYRMNATNSLARAASFFLGIVPNQFDADFLPSARSMAMRKTVWQNLGGFRETLPDCAEDTEFNVRLLKNNIKISRVKDALVEWAIPDNLKDLFWKFFRYAKGDAQTKVYRYPNSTITSHNIKAVIVLLRVLTAFTLAIASLFDHTFGLWFLILILIYIFYAFKKVFLALSDFKVGLWGIVVQFIADFAVVGGFISGQF